MNSETQSKPLSARLAQASLAPTLANNESLPPAGRNPLGDRPAHSQQRPLSWKVFTATRCWFDTQ